jgi:hypothetical protein
MSENRYSIREMVTFAIGASRSALARALGQTAYRGDRNYQEALGYVETPVFTDYMSRYQRQDIAARVVDLPAQDTWKRPPAITEGDRDDTEFVTAWKALEERLHVWSILSRLDRVAGIGRYGLLLIGMRGGDDLELPALPNSLTSEADIIYLQPYTEDAATVKAYEDSPQEPRFGLPLMYEVTVQEKKQLIHWTRVIHVADNKVESDIFGIPRLRQVLNRLDDLIKVVGGSAEASWLNMRPGTVLSEKEGYDMGSDETVTTAVDEAIREYAHDPLRMLRLSGIDASQLGTSEMVDPRGAFDVIISLIAAASGIPQRVLLGSALGELASAQEDRKQWGDAIASRQRSFAEPDILRPTIDRLQLLGALPQADYNVGTLDDEGEYQWPPLIQPTQAEEAEIQQARSSAWKNLEDPITQEPIGDRDEARAIMGMPPDEGFEPRKPLEEPEVPEEEAIIPTSIDDVLARVQMNWDRGETSTEAMAEFAIGQLLEERNGH